MQLTRLALMGAFLWKAASFYLGAASAGPFLELSLGAPFRLWHAPLTICRMQIFVPSEVFWFLMFRKCFV